MCVRVCVWQLGVVVITYYFCITSKWWGSLAMHWAGNKAKRLSSVNHTTKTIRHHGHYNIYTCMYSYYSNFMNSYFYLYIRRQLKKQIHFFFIPASCWLGAISQTNNQTLKIYGGILRSLLNTIITFRQYFPRNT